MNNLMQTMPTELMQALGQVVKSDDTVRALLLSLLCLSQRSDAELVWLAKLCGCEPQKVLETPTILHRCTTAQLIKLVQQPEFCDEHQLRYFAKKLSIENFTNEQELRDAVTKACVLNDTRLLLHSLWHPMLCPVSLLPWLAWSVSVDEWDESWSEALKRQVIRDAFEVHKYKGTPYALQKALDSLNIKTEVKEWWQQDDARRGTLQVWALINSNLDKHQQGILTTKMMRKIQRVINRVKRGSIHIDIQLGLAFKEQMGVFGAAFNPIIHRDTRLASEGVKPPKPKGNVSFQSASVTRQCNHVSVRSAGVKPEKFKAIGASIGLSKISQVNSIELSGAAVSPNGILQRASISAGFNHIHACAFAIQGQGILPDKNHGLGHVIASPKQLVIQHFNL